MLNNRSHQAASCARSARRLCSPAEITIINIRRGSNKSLPRDHVRESKKIIDAGLAFNNNHPGVLRRGFRRAQVEAHIEGTVEPERFPMLDSSHTS